MKAIKIIFATLLMFVGLVLILTFSDNVSANNGKLITQAAPKAKSITETVTMSFTSNVRDKNIRTNKKVLVSNYSPSIRTKYFLVQKTKTAYYENYTDGDSTDDVECSSSIIYGTPYDGNVYFKEERFDVGRGEIKYYPEYLLCKDPRESENWSIKLASEIPRISSLFYAVECCAGTENDPEETQRIINNIQASLKLSAEELNNSQNVYNIIKRYTQLLEVANR